MMISSTRPPAAFLIPWGIVFLLFIATSLSFLDRQVLSFAIINIKEDIPMTDIDYSRINAAFIIGYAIMFTLGGIIIDKYGTRFGLGLSVLLWSAASALHAFAGRAIHFGFFRFLLGVGEGAAFPGAIKSVVEWIPRKQRSMATGLAIGGAAIGAVVAPLLCLWLLDTTGWRSIFIITGGIGFIWAIAWFIITSRRNDRYRVKESLSGINTADKEKGQSNYSLKSILKHRSVWVFILMRVLFDPILYFIMFWTPKFLNEYRNMSVEQITKYLWIPYLALGISNFLGGYLSDRIYAGTGNLNIARKSIMGIAALVTLSVFSVKFIFSAGWIVALITLFFFAHGFWITNYVTVITDIFGRNSTSTIVGLSGSAGAVSGTLFSIITGLVVTGWSYDPLWIWAGLMYPAAFALMLVFIPDIRSESQ